MRIPENNIVISVLLIITLNIIVYANTFNVPFQFDDIRYIEQNTDILEPLDINSFINTFYLRGIVRWSYAVNYYFSEFNTPPWHAVNLSLHISLSILFFVILCQLYKGHARNFALFATLLFSLHPAQIESVTYLMSRSELFATLFYLLAFLFFIIASRSVPSNQIKALVFLALTLACFFMGLGSKLTVVSLPIILILYLFVINVGDNNIWVILRRYKWLLVGVFTAFLLLLIKRSFTGHGLFGVSGMAIDTYGRWGYFMTQVKAFYFYYLKLLFFPINLNVNPDFPFLPSLWQTLCLLLLTALALLYLVKNIKKSPLLFFSISWTIITLLPTSSIIPLNDLVAEHRLYLPSLGFFMAIGLILSEWRPSSRRAKPIFCLMLLIILPAISIKHNKVWNNEIALWEDALKKSPFHARPYMNTARSYKSENMLKEAVVLYETGNKIDNTYFEAHFNLGSIYLELGEKEKAAREFKMALFLRKNLPDAYINLGSIYMDQGKHNEATNLFMTALRYQVNCSVCFRNLAIIYYYHLKDHKKARFYFQQSLRLDPEQNQKREIQAIIDSINTS